MKIHKTGPKTVSKYVGFGHYEEIPTPLCVGAKGLYNGNSYECSRMWKHVSCKNCLNKRGEV